LKWLAVKKKKKRRNETWEGTKTLFAPTNDYYITPLLFVANLAVFIIMALQFHTLGPFSTEQVISWGANYAPMVKEGQWFRLVTSMFVHGGFAHLLPNLYGLLFAGVMLERIKGPRMMASVYFVTGIAASLASLLMHPDSASVGASGAIFGLWGFMLISLIVANFGRTEALLPVANFAIFIGLSLVVGLKKPHIDNAAHLAGLVVGLLLGAVFGQKRKKRRPQTSDA
jgi:membrane associated rhomboid family serine protease